MRNKLKDRGYPAMFVGYPDHRPTDVYEFMKLRNRALVSSRNIVWLNQNYKTYKNNEQLNILHAIDEEDDDEMQMNDVFEAGRIDEVLNQENDDEPIIISEDENQEYEENSMSEEESEIEDDEESYDESVKIAI